MLEFFPKVNFVCAVILGILFVSLTLIIFNLRETQDHIQVHVLVLLLMITQFIGVFKYYFNQNHNFRLYLSVYHQMPPPVLPWQLPDNFDPNSVILKIVPYDNKKWLIILSAQSFYFPCYIVFVSQLQNCLKFLKPFK